MRKKQFACRIVDGISLRLDTIQPKSNLKENILEDQEYHLDANGCATLPDGTPIIQPVPVDGQPEVLSKKTKKPSDITATSGVKCTTCSAILQLSWSPIKIHPVLKVVICKNCYKFYNRQTFQQDKSGNDENCRWCGDGGDLICCDTCPNAFCKRCLKRNLGRSALRELESLDDNDVWKCLVCDPSPIRQLQKECSELIKEMKTTHDEKFTGSKPRPLVSTSTKETDGPHVTTNKNGVISSQPVSKSTHNLLSQLGNSVPAPQIVSEPMSLNTPANFLQSLEQTTNCAQTQSAATKSTSQPSWSSGNVSIGRIAPRVRQCNLSFLPVAPNSSTAPHVTASILTTQAEPAIAAPTILTTPSTSFEVQSILNQIKNVNGENIRVALKATRRCIDTFSDDIQQLEEKLNKISHPNQLPPIVRSFQSAYRFHLFARLANLAARMREELPPLLNRAVGSRAGLMPFGTDPLNREPSFHTSSTIDLTNDNSTPSAVDNSTSADSATQLAGPKPRSSLIVTSNSISKTMNVSPSISAPTKNTASSEPVPKRMRGDAGSTTPQDIDAPVETELSGQSASVPSTTSSRLRSSTSVTSQTTVARTEDSVQPVSVADTSPDRLLLSDDDECVQASSEHSTPGESQHPPPSIQESSVRLEDIRHQIGDISVVDLKEASKRGLTAELIGSDIDDDGQSPKRTSDDELASSVTALEKSFSNLEKRKLNKLKENEPSGPVAEKTSKCRKKFTGRSKTTVNEDSWSVEEPMSDDGSVEPESVAVADVKQSKLRRILLNETMSEIQYRDRLLNSSSDEMDKCSEDNDSQAINKSSSNFEVDENLPQTVEDEIEPDIQPSRPTTRSKYTGELRTLMQPLSSLDTTKRTLSERSEKEETSKSEINDDSARTGQKRTRFANKMAEQVTSSENSGSETSSSYSSSDEFVDSKKKNPPKRATQKAQKGSRSGSNDTDSDDDSLEVIPRRSRRKRLLQSSDKSSDEDKPRKYSRDLPKKNSRRCRSRPKQLSDTESGEQASEKSANAEDGPNENASDESDIERKGRKKIRRIYTKSNLSQSTKTAEAEERERRRRISERQKLFNDCVVQEGEGIHVVTKQLVLEKPTEQSSSSATIQVHPKILKHLKPHQVEAVRFLWDCCIESVELQQKSPNDHSGGAILAHCMGLGKSLSVIAFVHTLFKYGSVLNISRCLIICPVNTLLNWKNEWEIWLPEDEQVDVYELASKPDRKYRLDILKHWFKKGGVMLMGYDMFRNFINCKKATRNKAAKEAVAQALLDPGPDIVVCDEGHMLKNDKSGMSKAVSQIRTLKRVVLTGTPLQNNLSEYHAMVNFVKPNLLGTTREFSNRFANPIRNGQHSNSTEQDVKLMKRRAHVLYKMLDGCVQRKDYNSLTQYLPPRYEYVIMCRLSEPQRQLYQTYLRIRSEDVPQYQGYRGEETKQTLFRNQQTLYRVWTHPFLLRSYETREARRMLLIEDDESFIDESDTTEESADTSSSPSSNEDDTARPVAKRRTRSSKALSDDDAVICLDSPTDAEKVTAEEGTSKDPWWYKAYKEEYDWCLEAGGKLEVLFRILKKCNDIGDKVIIFTQSLLSLDLLEKFLGEIHRQWLVHQGEAVDTLPEGQTLPRPDLSQYFSDINVNTWVRGHDYERLDGSMNAVVRKNLQHRFNRVSNTRLRLFLISTRAGGLGINLTAANRLILFDACWNPSHDIQSIFRSYRFGQNKPVYIYRLIAQGTMEEKIYDRQVTKQSLSLRVIDEQQVGRHFTMDDLQALYSFDPDIWDPAEADKRPTPKLPKDRLLADMLSEYPNLIVNYHEHDSLLAHREDEGLTETERQEAWREYEEEKRLGISLSQHQRLIQQQEIFAQAQAANVGSHVPMLDPRVFNSSVNRYNSFGAGQPIRPINPPFYTPIMPRYPIEQPRLPNVSTQYMELFEKYRAHVIKNRPSLAADPIQLQSTVLSYIMDSLSKQIRFGTPSTLSNIPAGQPGRSL